jgi:hypothetical protein
LPAGVPNVITGCAGGRRAAAPAPTQPAGRDESESGAYEGVVVFVVVVVVVVPVVVTPVARAEAAASRATRTPRRRADPRRIGRV